MGTRAPHPPNSMWVSYVFIKQSEASRSFQKWTSASGPPPPHPHRAPPFPFPTPASTRRAASLCWRLSLPPGIPPGQAPCSGSSTTSHLHRDAFLFASMFSSTCTVDLHIIQITPTGTIFQIPWGCVTVSITLLSYSLTASWRVDWLPQKSSSHPPLLTGLLSRSVTALTSSSYKRTLHLPPISCLLSRASDFLLETLSSSDFLRVSIPVSPISLATRIYDFPASSSTQLVMGLSHSSCPFVFSVCFPSSLLWARLLQWLTRWCLPTVTLPWGQCLCHNLVYAKLLWNNFPSEHKSHFTLRLKMQTILGESKFQQILS